MILKAVLVMSVNSDSVKTAVNRKSSLYVSRYEGAPTHNSVSVKEFKIPIANSWRNVKTRYVK